MSRFLLVSGVTLVLAALAMVVSAYAARRAGRVSVVDTTWGVALTVVAIVAAALGDGDPLRRWLVAGLVALWGLRLSWHMHRRNAGAGEDPRYAKMLREGSVLRKVWLPQGAAIWLVSLPVQANAVADDTLTVVGWIGVLVWAVGVFFESVGDAQLAAYKRAVQSGEGDRSPVMDRGLWRYTRHPNYFGDAAVWWGIWLVAAWPWPGLLTVVSPVAMTYFLAFATGARLLEQTMMQRPGYPEYAARTSMFVPLPRRGGVFTG